MFDTHCHLNFKALKKTLPEIIRNAQSEGVTEILIPGTDVGSSQRAVEVAGEHEGLYAAVGIHPHHVYKYLTIEANSNSTIDEMIESDITQLEALLSHNKVKAIGEVGMDRHEYQETKYAAYSIDERFLSLQKTLLIKQITLAVNHNKSLILHNREAKSDILLLIRDNWSEKLKSHTVLHCCEPDPELLAFAKEYGLYIGIDGDLTYTPQKQDFIKTVPLEMLVIETDSPYLLPEPLRTQKKYPNEPKNIKLLVEFLSELLGKTETEITTQTTKNAHTLFKI